ncbi:helix-turn-helix domain-containing protein [Sphaerisporangium sp. NPDC049002]|uniref:helix-turn-helix domain-containing protein n=1 Tax=Sphaerisporangium sp. NPDC049002 TaxID=3155392 RepID=UPI0033E8D7DE
MREAVDGRDAQEVRPGLQRQGAVRLVRETGKPIAQVARDLGICSSTLKNWVVGDRWQRGGGDGRLRATAPVAACWSADRCPTRPTWRFYRCFVNGR